MRASDTDPRRSLSLASRPVVLVLLELAWFLGVLHFAASPAGADVPPAVCATALVAGCVAIAVVSTTRRLAGAAGWSARFVGGALIVSGGVAVASGPAVLARDLSVVALGIALLLLPLAARPADSS